MRKLLNKPLKALIIYALIILGCSVPAYYFVVDSILIHETDKHNELVRKRIKNGFRKTQLSETELTHTLNIWDSIQPGFRLVPVKDNVEKPSTRYFVTRKVKGAHSVKTDLFRGLSSYIKIHGRYYHLIIETNLREKDETFMAITYIGVAFFVLLMTGFIILNRIIANKIWKPFKLTLDQLKEFDLGKHENLQFAKTDIEEFETLNTALSGLIENNIQTYKQQKEFAENASHELQTPLAILKSKLDLLLQDPSLTKEQSQLIASLNIPLSKVSRVNKNLLLLAKIENHQFKDDDHLDLTELINHIIELLLDHVVHHHIRIENKLSDAIPVMANQYLLDILFTNLLLNAIQYTNENGNVKIEYYKGVLRIMNSGERELNRESLFKRFISASNSPASSGLGLAIVKRICTLYHWQINYSFKDGFHIFEIQL